ncbi:MAG: hypothetical protein H6672_07485 [Anaerolineaceae bacterium]|nr:hypothetical protein [Anaerolineaceae bacterium]
MADATLAQVQALADQLTRDERESLIQHLQSGLTAVTSTPVSTGPATTPAAGGAASGPAPTQAGAGAPTAPTFTTVNGTVNATTNVRNGYRYNAKDSSDTDTKVATLKAGDQAVITGYTLYPPAGEYERRFRLEWNNQVVWGTASTFDVDSILGRRGLEFMPFNLEKPTNELLAIIGVSLDNGVSLDQAKEAAALLWDIELSRITSVEMFQEALDIVKKLENYGVMLGVEASGKWSIGNLRTVFNAIESTAKGTGALFEPIFGFRDDALAFRVMYGPLRITRSGKDNVNPFGDALWYARNTAGYEIVFGNRAFFENTQTTKSNPGLFYTSTDLVAHEVAHIINWRYPREIKPGSALTQKPANYYEAKIAFASYDFEGQTFKFKSYNEGYAMAARSSNGIHETVTDAVACLSLDRFTDDIKGRARKQQMTDYMRQVITYRVREHGGVDNLVSDIAKKRSTDLKLPAKMQPILEIMSTAPLNLDNELHDLGSKLTS